MEDMDAYSSKIPALLQDCRERALRKELPYDIQSLALLLTSVKGYPQEWFPSVSATIGDRYPERSVFQLFIAMVSGKIPQPALLDNH